MPSKVETIKYEQPRPSMMLEGVLSDQAASPHEVLRLQLKTRSHVDDD